MRVASIADEAIRHSSSHPRYGVMVSFASASAGYRVSHNVKPQEAHTALRTSAGLPSHLRKLPMLSVVESFYPVCVLGSRDVGPALMFGHPGASPFYAA